MLNGPSRAGLNYRDAWAICHPDRPMNAVMHAAGRLAGTVGMADRPGIPVVQPCPRRTVEHPVLGVGNIEVEIANTTRWTPPPSGYR